MKHDPLFRDVFGTPRYAAEHIALFLPTTVAKRLELERLEVVAGTFIDKELDERRTDLLFAAPVRGSNAGAFAYVLLEHQRRPDPMMPFRMLEYMVRIWDHWKKQNPRAKRLPPIFPMILSQGRWRVPRFMSELTMKDARLGPEWRRFLPDFDMQITELAQVDDDKLGGPVHATALRFMKLAHERDFKAKAMRSTRLIEDLRRVLDSPDDLWVIGSIMVYVAGRQDVDRDVVMDMFMDIAGEDKEDKVMNAGERWEQSVFNKGKLKGLKEGREEGREQGLEHGIRGSCLRLLKGRFGRLPVGVRRKLDAASLPELELWFDRAITAESLEEVFEQS